MVTTVDVTRSLVDKTVDQFYAKFFRLPENSANILGRQVESIQRPDLNFNMFEQWEKGVKRPNHARIDFQPISIVFKDDDSSLVINALYEQIKRQNGVYGAAGPAFEKAKFEIAVSVYSANDVLVEKFVLLKCFIGSINHSEHIMASSEKNRITVTVYYDTVDYQFPVLDNG